MLWNIILDSTLLDSTLLVSTLLVSTILESTILVESIISCVNVYGVKHTKSTIRLLYDRIVGQ